MVPLKTRFVTEGKHFSTESRETILFNNSVFENVVFENAVSKKFVLKNAVSALRRGCWTQKNPAKDAAEARRLGMRATCPARTLCLELAACERQANVPNRSPLPCRKHVREPILAPAI
jgi:hypothetical protein